MAELVVKLPEDVGAEFSKISERDWQLIFSRFLKRELDKIREIDAIASKSKATEAQVGELADEVSSAIAKRFLKK